MSESELYTEVAPEDQEKPRFDSKKYHREYYQNNKNQWKQKYGKLIKCDRCGVEVSSYNYRVHVKSKKHQVHELNHQLQNQVNAFQQVLKVMVPEPKKN